MARQSIAQETAASRRISFYVNERTCQILERLAAQRSMPIDKMVKEEIEHIALTHRSLVPVMGPEHYTARDNDQDTV